MPEVIYEQFPDRVAFRYAPDSTLPIWRFNDHPATTLADVEMVLEKAQVRLSEEVVPPPVVVQDINERKTK